MSNGHQPNQQREQQAQGQQPPQPGQPGGDGGNGERPGGLRGAWARGFFGRIIPYIIIPGTILGAAIILKNGCGNSTPNVVYYTPREHVGGESVRRDLLEGRQRNFSTASSFDKYGGQKFEGAIGEHEYKYWERVNVSDTGDLANILIAKKDGVVYELYDIHGENSIDDKERDFGNDRLEKVFIDDGLGARGEFYRHQGNLGTEMGRAVIKVFKEADMFYRDARKEIKEFLYNQPEAVLERRVRDETIDINEDVFDVLDEQ